MNQEQTLEMEGTALYFHEWEPKYASKFDLDRFVSELTEMHDRSHVLDKVGQASIPRRRRIAHPVPVAKAHRVAVTLTEEGTLCGLSEEWIKDIFGTGTAPISWHSRPAGIGVCLRYRLGKLIEAVTQGDGTSGIEITESIRAIRCIPTVIKSDYISDMLGLNNLDCMLEFRGVLAMQGSLVGEKDEEYLSKRDFVYRQLMMKSPRSIDGNRMRFLCSDILIDGEYPEQGPSEDERLRDISGYHGVNPTKFEFLVSTEGTVDKLKEELIRANGKSGPRVVVVKRQDADRIPLEGGYLESALEFDVSPEIVERELYSVEWRVLSSGTIYPVLLLGGTGKGRDLRECPIFSYGELRRSKVGIGSKLLIDCRDGFVPHIMRAEKSDGETQEIAYPESCPLCGELPTKFDGEHVYCKNQNCPSKLVMALCHYSRTMRITVGAKMLEMLVSESLVEDITSLYYLDQEEVQSRLSLNPEQAEDLVNAFLDVVEVDGSLLVRAVCGEKVTSRASDALIGAYGFKGIENATVTGMHNALMSVLGDRQSGVVAELVAGAKPTLIALAKVLTIKNAAE